MKRLDEFITEEDREKDNSKPKPIPSGKGKDDALYFELMSKYKSMRRKEPEKANKILEKAFKLCRTGDVSENAMVGAAYL